MAATASDPISVIAQATAGEIGTDFLAALVRSMHAAMDVSTAFITRGIGEPPLRARAAYSWRKPGFDFPEEYDLEDTPCQMVYAGQRVVIPKLLWQRFPKEDGCEGYCGIPLQDPGGRVVGHFAVISETPIADPERVESILRIFGMRVQAELQRLEREQERETLIGRLTHAMDRLTLQHQATRSANEFKSKTLSMVAHDLRNPLAVIFGRVEYVDTLLERLDVDAAEAPREQLHKAAQAIGQSAERMQRMIADLLASARDEATALTLKRAAIDIVMPLRIAIGLNQPKAVQKNIRIEEQLRDIGRIDADEDRLIEALDNLLSNAIKYSLPGSVVTVSVAADASGMAELRVSDQGLGMDADDLGRAFQRFQTLSAKPTGGETATGLGLAIVKDIAEAHGGSVEAASPGKGRGSTFTLRLPLASPARPST